MNIEQFSKEHLSAILGALIRVKGGEIDDYCLGICWNVSYILSGSEHSSIYPLDRLTPLWPKFSGNLSYPVPAIGGVMHPKDAYRLNKDKWVGEYGALRYELLDFLIDELTKVVNNGEQKITCTVEFYEGELP